MIPMFPNYLLVELLISMLSGFSASLTDAPLVRRHFFVKL